MTWLRKTILISIYLIITAFILGLWFLLAIINIVGPHQIFTIIGGLIVVPLTLLAMFSPVICIGAIANLNSPGEYIFAILLAKGSIIYDKSSGRIEKILKQEEFYWCWQYPYSDYETLAPLTNRSLWLKVAPIACNPEVRRLKLGVLIEPPVTHIDFQKLSDRLGKIFPDFDKAVMSLLYDFCEEKSNFLSTLYNPYRDEQQEQFKEVIFESLTPKLAEFGLTINGAEFSFTD